VITTPARPARATLLVAALLGLCALPAPGQEKKGDGKQPPPKPTHADVRYGPHPRNVLDLYLPAATGRPAPLVLFIHGGGFQQGDKRGLNPADAKAYLDAGLAVAALNYRLTDTAPMPAAYRDCGRALQFLRHHAGKWNLDPARVASTGSSAGAGTSLWLAFHDDLADPKSDDPVARQSTRLTCVAVQNAQSSYDPRFAEAIGLPRPNFERHSFFLPFYGIKADEIDTPKAYKLYDEAAPVTYLTRDDPPALLTYAYADEPVTNQSNLGLVVHHPRFGIALKERMDKLGIECEVVYRDRATGKPVRHGGGDPVRAVDFVVKKLGAAAKPGGP
jgi:acetyl esterase